MHGGRLKYLIISFAPLLLLSYVVYKKTSSEFSVLDSKREANKPVPVDFLPQKDLKTENTDDGYSKGLDIKGDEYFKENVKQALKLIWLSDKDSFYFIKKYVFEIRQESKTGFYFDEGMPVVSVSARNADSSLTWLAGIIAHNAWHAYKETLARAAKKNKKDIPLPGEKSPSYQVAPIALYEGKTFEEFLLAEKQACEYQEQILIKIGAPQKEINKVKNRDEKDFYIGHDGEYFVNN